VDWTTNVAVHESVAPEATRKRFITALKNREVDPTLLYSGLRQTSRWIALHHSVSPAKVDPDCVAIYDRAFEQVARSSAANVLHVIGLGCGDGSKDTNCLQLIREASKTTIYTPCDISLEMVLTAHARATSALRGLQSNPVLCELSTCSTMPAILKTFDPAGTDRLLLFLGTIHNYDPGKILKSLLHILRSQDRILISANLAPSATYEKSVSTILSQYDNAPTRSWLMGALSELGLDEKNGRLVFETNRTANYPDLTTIEANFIFSGSKTIEVFSEGIVFGAGEKLKVFTSTRFTVPSLRGILAAAKLEIESEWIARSEEEAVFLCRRK